MNETLIAINGLNLSFGNKKIISNLSLEIGAHKFHAVVGLSGAGKSQLLRTIAGLNGTKITNSSEKKTRIVFQDNNLIPWLTLKQNIQITTDATENEIDNMFKQLDLEKFKNYKPAKVSGGMQQRTGLIRAMIGECDLLLLDEAFSNLDPINKEINYEVLLELWKKKRASVLMVTHDLDEAIYLSQKISFFSKTSKRITYTEDVEFEYPRQISQIRKSDRYSEIFNKFNVLLKEDFQNENLG